LKELKEVVVTSARPDDNIMKPMMSTIRIESKTIQRIPALMGEVDIIKAIQLLPGVQSASEGSSGFSVRGGAPDQNLIMLDEATIYSASHLLGFFSVFNNDAVKDVTLYKGDIPPSTGGRLSSVLDVRMKEGNTKKFSAAGGVGNISSRLTLEGPAFGEKTSFMVSGRRTYADIFLPFAKDENVRDNTLYFYDLNAKINHRFNENNRLFLSGYFGRDIFKNEFAGMGFGNRTLSLRWVHLFSQKVFSNFTLINSEYDYEIGTPAGSVNSFLWISSMKDLSSKADFTYFIVPTFTLKFGASTSILTFDPGTAKGLGSESLFNEYTIPRRFALQHGIYAGAEHQVSEHLSVKYGIRYSIFQNTGKASVYYYNGNFEKIDSAQFGSGQIYNTYYGLEPRLGVVYTLNRISSLKASYSRTRQYVHLAQNSTAGTPLDLWFASGPNVKPQVADQFALGYFRNFRKNTLETSVEVYYKNMQHTIDFKDHANLLLNKEMEAELRFGKSWSYGMELLLRLYDTRLNGWVSYTYSKSQRRFSHINGGHIYPSPYDKPHDVSVVLNYDFSSRLVLSANWVYSTGSPITLPTGKAIYGGMVIPIYSDRNAYRLPDYHRLDLSVILKNKIKPKRKWEHEWNFSIYNAYGRKNTWAINFVEDETDPQVLHAVKTYLFSVVPAITFNFKF
ncbi:MAG: TonB-dependent receptor plug domain-containing protein, partial [Bacteroidales bacterium]|nr:TonB-dependent receptor plug domain-containing protein [Bacteroidales bacterium]